MGCNWPSSQDRRRSQITATIPTALLSVPGDLQLAVADTNNHVAYLEVVVSPGDSTATFSTNVLNFLSQNVGTTSAAQTLTLTNTGNTPLSVTNVKAGGDFRSDQQLLDCGRRRLLRRFCRLSLLRLRVFALALSL